MYCSLSGGSLLLHPSPLPLKDNVVFPLCLDVAVGQDGGHKRKYAAMMQLLSRAGVKVSTVGDVRAHWSEPEKTRQFEFQRR